MLIQLSSLLFSDDYNIRVNIIKVSLFLAVEKDM